MESPGKRGVVKPYHHQYHDSSIHGVDPDISMFDQSQKVFVAEKVEEVIQVPMNTRAYGLNKSNGGGGGAKSSNIKSPMNSSTTEGLFRRSNYQNRR